MKTAISLPDELFEAAERLARSLGKTRSALYGQAVAEFLARHEADAVTDAMNATCDAITGGTEGKFSRAAARKVLERVEW